MPSLILHVDEILETTFEISAFKAIEKCIIDIIQEELEAEKNNCQIIWVKSKIICSNYKIFGEVGVGEDINEGTPVGSGASFDYLRFGISKVFFDSFKINLNYRSKMKSADRDLNWIVINTKYKF